MSDKHESGKTVKTDLAEAAWWLFWTFALVAGAIRQVRDGGTWIPAGSVVGALLCYSNFLRAAARVRAAREDRSNVDVGI